MIEGDLPLCDIGSISPFEAMDTYVIRLRFKGISAFKEKGVRVALPESSQLVVAMTGATGQIYGIKALEIVREIEVDTHLILSKASRINITNEEDYSVSEVEALADAVHDPDEIDLGWMSETGTGGMLVAPCSMNTLANVAHGLESTLIGRCAGWTLRLQRPLILMPREKPFNRIHLQNMLEVDRSGGTIMPPFPSFYMGYQSLEDMIQRTVLRTLKMFDFPVQISEWEGLQSA